MSYSSFVTKAPAILFWIGWGLAALTFLFAFVPALLRGNPDVIVTGFFGGILNALQVILVPWIASAALWRFDTFLETRA